MIALVDGTIHHQDIRRTLGRPRDVPADRIFGPYAHHRLRAVKAAYDLADVFRSNHPVLPARSV